MLLYILGLLRIMHIELPEVQRLLDGVSRIERVLADIGPTGRTEQEWWSLKEACRLKGVNYNTVASRTQWQPNGGRSDAVICGRKRWRRTTVERWLNEADDGPVDDDDSSTLRRPRNK